MKHFQAIAAMSLNRVIGRDNQIPWHLPEDLRWFKQMTTGHVVVMGRRTFESLPKPLPGRRIIVLTRDPQRFISAHAAEPRGFREWPGVNEAGDLLVCRAFEDLDPSRFPSEVFVCGGAEIYRQALPRCADLYLTLVKREVPGDAFFPAFEGQFELRSILRDTPEFELRHYRNCELRPASEVASRPRSRDS